MRPNILWYCTDQQRFDTIRALGNTFINTPRLDQFITESVAFTHAYCQAPICTPSRSSFLTGMYPSAVGVNGNGNTDFPQHMETRLIPHILTDQGYDCGLVGKLHLASPAPGIENRVDDGYDFFKYSHDHRRPNAPGHDYAQWIRDQGANADELMQEFQPRNYRQGAENKNFGGVYAPTPENDNIPAHLHQTRWCTERAIEFIEQERPDDQPWFLSVNAFDPHAPFDPPWEYFQRYQAETMPGAHFQDSDLVHQRRLAEAGVDFQSNPKHPEAWDHKQMQAAYYAMIELIDTEFGRLQDYLDTNGLRENTIIIFMSDHGEMLGDHGLVLKGCRFYEGLVRVPLILSWPGHIQLGVTSNALVELLDIVPTLYDLIGFERPYYVQGQSLVPVLKGETDQHRDAVRTEFFGAIDFPDQTHATMYRDNRWKLVCYHDKGLCELYDLENDPWEHHDLAEHPDYQAIKWELLQKSFDRTVNAHLPDPPREYPF